MSLQHRLLLCFFLCGFADLDLFADDLLVNLLVNNKKCEEIVTIKRNSTSLHIPMRELNRCQVYPPNATAEFIDLSESTAIKHSFDMGKLRLTLEVPDSWLEPEFYDASTAQTTASPEKTYAMGVNYDVSANNAREGNFVNFLPEALGFTPFGLIKSIFLVRSNADNRFLRLDSFFVKEFSENMFQLRLGDSITRCLDWAHGVRIGGIQFSSNFHTRPNFIPYPLPSITGNASVPSVLDAFANNVKIYGQDLKTGPYQIKELPVVTGAGSLRVQTADLLGRQTTIEVPYYVSPHLLKKGLSDFSYDLGFLRRNFAVESNDYGDLIGSMTHRYGLTNACRVGVHSEISRALGVLGGDLTYMISTYGVASVSYAQSLSQKQKGNLIHWSISRHADPIGFGLKMSVASHNFSDLSLLEGGDKQRFSIQSFINYFDERWGSATLSFTKSKSNCYSRLKLLTFNYQKQFINGFSINFSLSKNFVDQREFALQLGLVKVFDNSYSAISSVNQEKDRSRQSVSFQKSLSAYYGTSYQGTVTNDSERETELDASVYHRNQIGDLSLRVFHANGGYFNQGTASGGVILAQGNTQLTPKIYDSIGLVKVGEIEGVSIENNNQYMGQTNAQGNLVVPNLKSFANSDIQFNEKELPVESQFKDKRMRVFADSKSAYLIDFKVKSDKSRSVKIVSSDSGIPLSPGQPVKWGDGSESIVGFDGEIYVKVPQDQLVGKVTSGEITCQIILKRSDFDDMSVIPIVPCGH